MALAEPRPTPDSSGEQSKTDLAPVVLEAMAERPASGWRTSELTRHPPEVPVVDLIVTIATMHFSGRLERVAPATYRLPAQGPEITRMINEARLWD